VVLAKQQEPKTKNVEPELQNLPLIVGIGIIPRN